MIHSPRLADGLFSPAASGRPCSVSQGQKHGSTAAASFAFAPRVDRRVSRRRRTDAAHTSRALGSGDETCRAGQADQQSPAQLLHCVFNLHPAVAIPPSGRSGRSAATMSLAAVTCRPLRLRLRSQRPDAPKDSGEARRFRPGRAPRALRLWLSTSPTTCCEAPTMPSRPTAPQEDLMPVDIPVVSDRGAAPSYPTRLL